MHAIDDSLRRLGTRLRRSLPDPPLRSRTRRSRKRSRRSTTSCAPAKRSTSAPPRCSPGSSRKCSTRADQLGLTRFVSMQNHYNLIYREEEREMIPLCREEGIGADPVEPAGARLPDRQPAQRGLRRNRPRQDRRLRAAAVLPGLRLRRGGPRQRNRASGAAFQTRRSRWPGCCNSPASPRPIIGASKMHHLDDAVAALDSSSTTPTASAGRALPAAPRARPFVRSSPCSAKSGGRVC